MIDQERLAELRRDFGDDDLGEIIESFLEETGEAMDALAEMRATADPDRLSAQFHLLKGCTRNIGAAQFADICERFENDPAAFDDADHADLKAEFAAVCDWFAGDEMRRSA